ncbi:hypothetical protein [Dactylosporangium sp. CA-233914]|uniref:hypothetical protein n=1 Tax=Dactylosporangium sp. CA-233914 TaxID=3239934 RepID=UPI003D8AD69F
MNRAWARSVDRTTRQVTERGSGMELDIVDRWVSALRYTESMHVNDVSRAMGVAIIGAERVSCQLVCPPPAGTARFEFVLDLETKDRVIFVEFMLAEPLPLSDLEARFGIGEVTVPSPHQVNSTIAFEPPSPERALRACSVLADLEYEWPRVGPDRVRSIVLYPQPREAEADSAQT